MPSRSRAPAPPSSSAVTPCATPTPTRWDARSDKAEAAERIPEPTYVVKPKVPRSFDFPFVKSRSPYARVVNVEKIEIEHDKTVVYFSYCDRTPAHRPLYDKGLSINKDIYICNLADVETIDIVEPGAEGFNFYGIDVRSPLSFKEMKKLEEENNKQ